MLAEEVDHAEAVLERAEQVAPGHQPSHQGQIRLRLEALDQQGQGFSKLVAAQVRQPCIRRRLLEQRIDAQPDGAQTDPGWRPRPPGS